MAIKTESSVAIPSETKISPDLQPTPMGSDITSPFDPAEIQKEEAQRKELVNNLQSLAATTVDTSSGKLTVKFTPDSAETNGLFTATLEKAGVPTLKRGFDPDGYELNPDILPVTPEQIADYQNGNKVIEKAISEAA